jgi:Extensin-like protein C-terminus
LIGGVAVVGVVGVVVKGMAWLWAAEGGPATATVAAAAGKSADDDVVDEATPNQICLDGLRERKVHFVEWPTKGVRTPVRILGPLGGIQLRSHDPRSTTKSLLMDCELARALVEAAPAFQGVGVSELRYSGAYQYRTRRHSTKLSEHAHGLAIDIHAFVLTSAAPARIKVAPSRSQVDFPSRRSQVAPPSRRSQVDSPSRSQVDSPPVAGTARSLVAPGDTDSSSSAAGRGPAGSVAEVLRDFEPRVGKWAATATQDECIGSPLTDVGRTLRRLACRLRASSIFREVITPDDNADHHDHFHLEAFPDALTRTRGVLARKPTVTDE